MGRARRRGGLSLESGAIGDGDTASAACVKVSKRWAGGAVTWVLGSIAACLRPPFASVPEGLGALVYGTTTTLLDRLEVQETVEGSASLPRRVVLDDGTPRRFHLRWTTFLVLYGDLAKELRAFADVADAWLETLPNRPRRLQRDESGAEADEDLDDGEGAA